MRAVRVRAVHGQDKATDSQVEGEGWRTAFGATGPAEAGPGEAGEGSSWGNTSVMLMRSLSGVVIRIEALTAPILGPISRARSHVRSKAP